MSAAIDRGDQYHGVANIQAVAHAQCHGQYITTLHICAFRKKSQQVIHVQAHNCLYFILWAL